MDSKSEKEKTDQTERAIDWLDSIDDILSDKDNDQERIDYIQDLLPNFPDDEMLVEYLYTATNKDIERNINRFGDENISSIRNKLIRRRNENVCNLIKTQVKALQLSESISSQIKAVSEFKRSVSQGVYNEILDPCCEQRKELDEYMRNEIEILELKNTHGNLTDIRAGVRDVPATETKASANKPDLILWLGNNKQLYDLINLLFEKQYIIRNSEASTLIVNHFCTSTGDLHDKAQICDYLNEENSEIVEGEIKLFKWATDSTQLCYLIAKLIEKEFLPSDMNKGETIADHFCTKTGSSYYNRTINQTYSNIKNNKTGKCYRSQYIDMIIQEIQ